MFVSLTRVDTADQPMETAVIVAEEMARWLREIEGFEGLLMLSREGTTVGLTFWESRDLAERHRAARLQFRDRVTSIAGVEIEEALELEVAYAELGPRLAELSSRSA